MNIQRALQYIEADTTTTVQAWNFRVEGEAVLYDCADGLRCACQVGSTYWVDLNVRVEAEELIRPAMRFSR